MVSEPQEWEPESPPWCGGLVGMLVFFGCVAVGGVAGSAVSWLGDRLWPR